MTLLPLRLSGRASTRRREQYTFNRDSWRGERSRRQPKSSCLPHEPRQTSPEDEGDACEEPSGRRILSGLGSGEEQDAANHAAVAFGTFAGQDEYAEELLGEDHYATQFFNALNSDETEAAIEEVGTAVGEAKQEHDLLGAFASGLDAPLE